MGSIPGSGRSPGGGNGNPLQYSSLENPMDRGRWQATVQRVAKSQTWLKWLSMHIHTTCFIVCHFYILFFPIFWPDQVACGILVPQPGIKLTSSALEAQSPNHWTTREVLLFFLIFFSMMFCHRILNIAFPGLYSRTLLSISFIHFLTHYWPETYKRHRR